MKLPLFPLVIIIGLLTAIQRPAIAHLKGDPGVSCFRMENHEVVEIDNPLTVPPYAEIISVEPIPGWLSQLSFGQTLHFEISFSVAHCRPFNIFAQPVYIQEKGVVAYTSPSPIYGPGDIQGTHTAFIGFKRSTQHDTVQKIRPSGVRITIAEYGTHKILAEMEIPVHTTWHARTTSIAETEQCLDEMIWPPGEPANQQCTNATNFGLRSGFRIAGRLDLNDDGICELAVEVESCRKLNNNTCYKIYAERNGYFQEIWQYYNHLKVFGMENGYHLLGSTETGPVQHVHRLGRYDPSRSQYVTQRYLSPCR